MKTSLEIFYQYHTYFEDDEHSMNVLEEEQAIKALDAYAKEVLTHYTEFLVKSGYCDTDVYNEPPSAIDRFLYPKIDK